MCVANGADDFRLIHQVLDQLNELLAEVLALFREVSGQVEALSPMPTGVAEHAQNAFASTLRHLCGHRIKENLENRGVAMGNDQAHPLSPRSSASFKNAGTTTV